MSEIFKLKYYLQIPYDKKDLAKQYKCLWDNDEKKWYTYDFDNILVEDYIVASLSHFVYDDKEYIKKHGGRYDPLKKEWFTYASNHKLEKYF